MIEFLLKITKNMANKKDYRQFSQNKHLLLLLNILSNDITYIFQWFYTFTICVKGYLNALFTWRFRFILKRLNQWTRIKGISICSYFSCFSLFLRGDACIPSQQPVISGISSGIKISWPLRKTSWKKHYPHIRVTGHPIYL